MIETNRFFFCRKRGSFRLCWCINKGPNRIKNLKNRGHQRRISLSCPCMGIPPPNVLLVYIHDILRCPWLPTYSNLNEELHVGGNISWMINYDQICLLLSTFTIYLFIYFNIFIQDNKFSMAVFQLGPYHLTKLSSRGQWCITSMSNLSV